MSAWADIVARVVAQMQAIQNIGLVHDDRPLAITEDAFYAIARTDVGGEERIRTWRVFYERIDASWATHDAIVDWTRDVVIEGFFQLEDAGAGEDAITQLTESVCAAIDTDIKATKLSSTVRHAGPCRVEVNEPRILAFVLCHYVKIVCPVETSEQR